ncbi:MAG: lysozyme inhibitor LprI family protein [Marinobacter sp.]|uniref:lysozyme inhibitor LprI family protein n=1 Tax=Marinobacter sp. TaxID=50741 RepID=UPI003F970720
MKLILSFFVFLTSTSVFANSCDNPRDDFDGLYCLNKIYQEADNELNIAYKNLRSFLTSSEKQKLKNTQVSWIKERNSKCSYRADNDFYVSLSCANATTIKRTNTLNDRIRECRATGCQSSKL